MGPTREHPKTDRIGALAAWARHEITGTEG